MLQVFAPRAHPAMLLSLLALGACGGGDPGVQIGPPSRLEVATGGDQTGTVGAIVATPPTVRVSDAQGNGVSGVSVRFVVAAGGGTVAGDSVVTNTEGLATVGQWRLGSEPGQQQLQAQVISFPLQLLINATAGAGPPASVQAIAGGGVLSAIVGQAVFPAPTVRVRDGFGNPIAGTTVTFDVTLGGGTVTGAQQTTDAEGRATVGGWTLGPLSGNNRMIARTTNGLVATFNATGVGIPSAVESASPADQAGIIKFPIPVVPRVRVLDQQGQGVPGLAVNFAVTAGDGTVSGATATTNNNGVAALGDWRLGAGTNHAVSATVPGMPDVAPIVFTSTATPRDFTIDVRFVSPLLPSQRDAFVQAALKWMDVIVGDLPDVFVNRSANSCYNGATHPAVNELVDDIVIFAEVKFIDGPGIVLGQAGPCVAPNALRSPSSLPFLGQMQFDQDDLPLYEATGRLLPLILHEMGHVLGLGTLWATKNLVQGSGGSDPFFTGTQARLAWPQLGINHAGEIVPVENTGGSGTAFAHWRESVLDRELMTGIIEAAGIAMPLSVVTAASMIDLGYQVNLAASEPFTPPGLRADGTPHLTSGGTALIEILVTPEGRLMPDGKLVPHKIN